MQYDSLFSVSKAIASKMGADSTKKYDSTYSVMLEILNRIGSAGGGDASKLESVDVLPTEGVKDGDMVYLKGNAEKEDGFYVAAVSDKDGLVYWHIIVDDKIGIIKTDSLNYVIKHNDTLFLKTDDDGYNKIYGTYHTDRVVDKPLKYETNYYEATLNITDADWGKFSGGILLTVDIIVPSISQNNQCILEFDYKENINIHINGKFVDIFDIQNVKANLYKIVYKSDNSVFCLVIISDDRHSIVFESKTRGTNPFYVRATTIQGNTLDLSQSEGVIDFGGNSVHQYMPYQDKDGNIIEGGKKLSEKYNPYHTTKENTNLNPSGYISLPYWNDRGQIIGEYTRGKTYFTLNNKLYPLTGGSSINENFKIFAPSESGTAGQILQSNGNAAPIWTDLIKIQKITQDAYDALETKDDNVLYVITD